MTNSEECTTSHTSSDRSLDRPEQRRKGRPHGAYKQRKRAATEQERAAKEEESTVHELAMTNSATVTTRHTSNTAAVIHPERRVERQLNRATIDERGSLLARGRLDG